MPTTRRRYQITETDEIARAIDAAAHRWPGEPRSRLIVRAIVAGGEALVDADAVAQRLSAIERLAGLYPDDYGPGYLEQLREDWPA